LASTGLRAPSNGQLQPGTTTFLAGFWLVKARMRSEQPLAGGRSWGLRSALDLRVEGGGGPLVISPPPGGAIGA
jgi:hypothetical protein